MEVQIAGGGPAGSAAAIAALSQGAAVHIFERSRAPRHKVCGEFIAPEACRVLEALGLWSDFVVREPPPIRRCILHFGKTAKQWKMSEPAFGFSRFALDSLLLERAVALGARLSRGESLQQRDLAVGEIAVLANGRQGGRAGGPRLFGFKAHFEGPSDDAVELFFTRFGYVGVSAIEGNLTNVCGLAPEDSLRRCGFDIDEFLAGEPALAERLRPLAREMPWIKTGPLIFSRVPPPRMAPESVYPAGDALGFVDPFTGSGILNALLTGNLAGTAAARRTPVGAHVRDCAALLSRPFAMSALLRVLLRSGLGRLAYFVPGNWLYRLTRAGVPGGVDG